MLGGAWKQANFYKPFNADADSEFSGPPGSVAYGAPSTLIKCEAQETTKSVSVSLSGTTLVIGAPYEDSAAVGVNGVPTSDTIADSGAAYVFETND